VTREIAPVINVADVKLAPNPIAKPGSGFEAMMGAIAAPLGATKLGCRLTVVPPGNKAWPHHVHHANDEMFVILAGEGTLRYGKERYALRPGDVVVCPSGGAENAHQIINTSGAELRYLAISTMIEPEVAEYPDSGKFGVLSVTTPDAEKSNRSKRRLIYVGRLASNVDYYDGEC